MFKFAVHFAALVVAVASTAITVTLAISVRTRATFIHKSTPYVVLIILKFLLLYNKNNVCDEKGVF